MPTPRHETLPPALLLAVVGGFLDTYTYFTRGGVFANAQTGNMVLLSIAAAQGKFLQAASPKASGPKPLQGSGSAPFFSWRPVSWGPPAFFPLPFRIPR